MLEYLAERAGISGTGEVWESVARIAAGTAMSTSSARIALRALEAHGLITQMGYRPGYRSPVYRVNLGHEEAPKASPALQDRVGELEAELRRERQERARERQELAELRAMVEQLVAAQLGAQPTAPSSEVRAVEGAAEAPPAPGSSETSCSTRAKPGPTSPPRFVDHDGVQIPILGEDREVAAVVKAAYAASYRARHHVATAPASRSTSPAGWADATGFALTVASHATRWVARQVAPDRRDAAPVVSLELAARALFDAYLALEGGVAAKGHPVGWITSHAHEVERGALNRLKRQLEPEVAKLRPARPAAPAVQTSTQGPPATKVAEELVAAARTKRRQPPAPRADVLARNRRNAVVAKLVASGADAGEIERVMVELELEGAA